MKFQRRLVVGALLLLAAACTRVPAVAPDASFAAFFQRLRTEPAFRLARTESEWQAEHRQRDGSRTLAVETIRCGYVEIERNSGLATDTMRWWLEPSLRDAPGRIFAILAGMEQAQPYAPMISETVTQ